MSPPMHKESPDPVFHPTSRTFTIRTSEQKSDSAAQKTRGSLCGWIKFMLSALLLINIIRDWCIFTAVDVTAVIHALSTATQSQVPRKHQSDFSDLVLKLKIIYLN